MVRPTLADMVLKMPRGAQVIYPKDLAAILMEADIAPGVRVLEAGVGSGALSMALLRAGASVVGYELREDFANRAHNNVVAMVGDDADYRVELRDVYEGIEERGLDRIVLDLPEPWRVVPHAEVALRSGGHHLRLPADHQPDGPVPPRPRRERVRHGRPPSRCCTGPGTSRTARSGPTTAWSATPGSSPRPACSAPRSWAADPAARSAGCRPAGAAVHGIDVDRPAPTTMSATTADADGRRRPTSPGRARSASKAPVSPVEPFASLRWPTEIGALDAKRELADGGGGRGSSSCWRSAGPAAPGGPRLGDRPRS